MKNKDQGFTESCRRFLREEVSALLQKRDVAILKLTKRQMYCEERLNIVETHLNERKLSPKRQQRITAASLVAFRKRTGVNQRELAQLLGTTPAAVCLWEQGRRKLSPRYKSKFLDLRTKKKKEIAEILKSMP